MRYIYIPVFFIYFSCVSPPEYDDGLIENIPAIVNDDDYFSLSVNGNNYNDSLSWELNLDLSDLEPLNNPLELSNVSREDKDKDRNEKKKFLDNSPESDEDYFNVPKIIE